MNTMLEGQAAQLSEYLNNNDTLSAQIYLERLNFSHPTQDRIMMEVSSLRNMSVQNVAEIIESCTLIPSDNFLSK